MCNPKAHDVFGLVGYCVSFLILICSGHDFGCPVIILVFVELRNSCCHYKLLKAMVENAIIPPS